MLSRDYKFMEFVRRLAIDNKGVNNRFKLAAALVIKRDVISIGTNQLRTHPLQKQYGKNEKAIFLHAEICAIVNSLNHIEKDELKKATLYVYRVKKEQPFSSDWCDGEARPCVGCQSAISAFGIPRVIYSTNKNNVYEELFA